MLGSDGKSSLERKETDFGLVNLELGTHNVPVDKAFNVLAVIDWDTTFTAPRAVCHHFPWCVGASPGFPGGESRVFKSLDGQRDMTVAFCGVIIHASELFPDDTKTMLFTIDEFLSKATLAFRGIASFGVKQNWGQGVDASPRLVGFEHAGAYLSAVFSTIYKRNRLT